MSERESSSAHPLDPPAYSVPEFCKAHDISRGYLYDLWKNGRGPRYFKLGRRTIVSGEAAAEWRRRMEEETEQLASGAANERV